MLVQKIIGSQKNIKYGFTIKVRNQTKCPDWQKYSSKCEDAKNEKECKKKTWELCESLQLLIVPLVVCNVRNLVHHFLSMST